MATATGNTFKINKSLTGDGKSVTSVTGTFTGDAAISIDDSIAAGATKEYDVSFPASTIQACVIQSDQTTVVKTNSTSSPADTITLVAKQGHFWGTGDPSPCPILTAVTKIYATNNGSSAATFQVRVLYNTLP